MSKVDDEIAAILDLIRRKRIEKNISQKEMAESLHLTQQAYQMIESGKTELKLKTIYQIALFLEIDIFNPQAPTPSTSLVAFTPESILNTIGGLAEQQEDMKKKQDDMNSKLDKLLALFDRQKP